MPVVDQPSPVTTSEQQAVPVAQGPASIWLSPACEITAHDGRTWANPAPATACDECGDPWVEYVRADLALPCKSGEGAEAVDARAEGRKILEAVATSPRDHEYQRAAFRLIRQMDGAYYDPAAYGDDWLKVLVALTPDATQTREAELVAALKPFANVADGEVWERFIADSNMGLRISDGSRAKHYCFIAAEAFQTARAALNARGAA